jgi:cysteinyl-tRNA synthetase
MRLYNTLTRTEEPFAPSRGNTVRMYTCGLTVYARGHIGNFRTFVCLDVLRRTLRYLLGYEVRQVMNFTDVDDRTILGAQKAGMELRPYTDQFIAAFLEDAKAMGLEPVEEMPRATDEENLKAMADLIARLTANGHTYVSDGSIYFKISSMADYGKLAHLDREGMQDGASSRVDVDHYAKDDVRDFVLWKGTKPGEPTWTCVDPPGRPGWHLECSAMALRLLGEPPIDIHGGGIDLIFPHHENEIAQAEGATGKQFSRFWVHVEYLLVDAEKMSKSLGNTYTIPDIVAKGYRASAVRYLLLSSHYRKQLNFTWESLASAEKALQRLMALLGRLDGVTRPGSHPDIAEKVKAARDAFGAALRDDLNTAGALGTTFELVTALNSAIDAGQFGVEDAALVRDAFDAFDRVLGVLSLRRAEEEQTSLPIAEIEKLIEDRHAAKVRRDFPSAVKIRKELSDLGIVLEDTPAGTKWKRK